MRRRNKVVGLRAVSMTGISVLPLGYDDAGREYWKFPVSEDLFVCSEHLSDSAQLAFQEQLIRDRAEQRAEAEEELRQQEVEESAAAAGMLGASDSSRMDVDSDADSDDDILKSRSNSIAAPASAVATTASASAAASTAMQCFECKPTEPKISEQAGRKPNGQPDRKWKRLSEVSDIRRVVELLGASEKEQALRKNIINALLLERTVPSSAAVVAMSADASSSAEVKSESGADDSKSATSATTATAATAGNPTAGTLNSWIDRSRSSNSLGESAGAAQTSNGQGIEHDPRALVKRPVVDIVPAAMRLMPTKGQDILPTYVIQQEAVFEEEGGSSDNEDDDEDDITHSEYFTFSKGRK